MFETFEHKADIGIRGKGHTIEEAFAECAKAMFSVMVELKEINAKKTLAIKVSADDIEQLLVNFLNELLYLKDTKSMLFADFKIKRIYEKKGKWFLEGNATGEQTDEKKHSFKTEVKAASYSGLRVGKENNIYFAECIVDV